MSNKCLRFSFCFVLLAIINPLFSQKIFREGYITKSNGQSLHGFVVYTSGKGTPDVCVFKRFEIATEVKYTASELKDFGYQNGNRYISIKNDENNEFYEVLVQGELILYLKGSAFFLKKAGTELIELKSGSSDILFNEQKFTFTDPISLLKFLTEDKVDIPEKTDIKDDIVRIVSEYNKKSGQSYFVYKQNFSSKTFYEEIFRKDKGQKEFGITIGSSFYSLGLKKISNFSFYNPRPGISPSLTLGLTSERTLFLKNNHFILRTDLLFMKQNFYSYTETTKDYHIMRDDAYFYFTGIKMPVALQYSIPMGKIMSYITGGAAGVLFLTKNYYHLREEEIPAQHVIYTSEDRDFKFKTMELSGLIGVGAKIIVLNNTILSFRFGLEYGQGLFKKNPKEYVEFKEHSFQTFFQTSIIF